MMYGFDTTGSAACAGVRIVLLPVAVRIGHDAAFSKNRRLGLVGFAGPHIVLWAPENQAQPAPRTGRIIRPAAG